jgi:competence protein ComEC
MAVIFLMPLFIQKPQALKPGEIYLTVLDVGQGLSVVVQTANHVLVYDTGAKYSTDFDMGSAVVVPYLRYQYVKKVDEIVISHGDNDHIGGLGSLLQAYRSAMLLTSVPSRVLGSTLCLQGQHWNWDGVTFDILYPDSMHLNLDNNSSCVLRISNGNKAILLTGEQLTADIIVAPHHGSKTSSTKKFLAAVKPQYVVFATGYLNRFNFPSKSVVERYQAISAMSYNTALDGAVSFIIKPDQAIQPAMKYKESLRFLLNISNSGIE